MSNTNASATQAGFHYQDMIGLLLLFENIVEVDSINVEGTDDVDVYFSDGTVAYYQVKEVTDPNNTNMSTKLHEALKTLEEDAKHDNVRLLGYVSNANQLLGGAKGDMTFSPSYMQYEFDLLPEVLKEKIDSKLKQDSIIDRNKLRVLKIHYAGADEASKHLELDKRIDSFVERAGLHQKFNLKNEWIRMVSRSTESEKKEITKQELYAHTIVLEAFTTPEFGTFFDRFNIAPGNEMYIKRSYQNQVTKLIQNFELLTGIRTGYMEFREDHKQLMRNDLTTQFMAFYWEKLKTKLGLTQSKDNDVVKLIIWIAIQTITLGDEVKGVMNL